MSLFLKSIFLFCVCFCFSQQVVTAENEHEIFEAVEQNNVEKVRRILSADKNVVSVRNNYGETLLHRARTVEMATLLLEHGADVHARSTREGNTPINEPDLLRSASIELIEVLLKHGADVRTSNDSGTTPLHFASLVAKPEILELLLNRGADIHARIEANGMTAIYYARTAENVGVLLDRGAKVDDRDKLGKTPLHEASTAGVAKALLDRGADVHAIDKDGKTPIFYYAAEAEVEVVRVLLEHGAEINKRDNSRATSLSYTLEEYSQIFMRGKSLYLPEDVETAVFERDYVKVIQAIIFFVKNGATVDKVPSSFAEKINAKSPRGDTLLYQIVKEAAENGGMESLIMFLVQNGARVSAEVLNQEATVILFGERISKSKPGELSLEYIEAVRQLVKTEVSDSGLSEDVLKALDARIAKERQRSSGGSNGGGGGTCSKGFE